MKTIQQSIRLWLALAIGVCLTATVAAQEDSAAEFSLTIAPQVQFASVDGNEYLFQEHHWMTEGSDGGAVFAFSTDNSDLGSLSIEGEFMNQSENFDVELVFVPVDSIFTLTIGGSNFRKYFDDTGTYYAPDGPDAPQLGDEMFMDMGTFFIELGINADDFPMIIIGYELRTREGRKSTLEFARRTKSNQPAYKDIDEEIHTFYIDVTHEIGGFNITDHFRYIVFDGEVYRRDEFSGSGHEVPEEWNETIVSNTLVLDRWVTDELLVSFGYMYEDMEGDSYFHVIQFPFLGVNHAKDFEAFVDDISSESHIGTLSAMWLPSEDWVVLMGLQAEATQTDTAASFVIKEENDTDPNNGFAPIEHIDADSSIDKQSLKEELEIRYGGIEGLLLYTRARWEQQNWNKTELENEAGTLILDRESDTDVDRESYRAGFTISPASSVNVTAYYQRSINRNNYNHIRDLSSGAKDTGYTAFITHQTISTDEVAAKLSIQHTSKLQSYWKYQLLSSEVYTETDPTDKPGEANSNDYEANTFTLGLVYLATSELVLSGQFYYRDVVSKTIEPSVTGVGALGTYYGDVYAASGNASYKLNDDTSVQVRCRYEVANNDQDSVAAAGLPLAVSYVAYSGGVSLIHNFSDNVSATVAYDAYRFGDEYHGDAGDYTAHVVSAMLNLTF